MVGKLVECTDSGNLYGILIVAEVDEIKVQSNINEIKRGFEEEGFTDWTIEDILEAFPSEWNWSFFEDVKNLEV